MIDLVKDYSETVALLQSWKRNYNTEIYLNRKILRNLMFHVCCTKIVFDDFNEGKMPIFDSFDESLEYISDYFDITAHNIHPNFVEWLRDNPTTEIGTVNYDIYKKMAREAESDTQVYHDFEFVFIFELLDDMCILYYIANRLSGMSEQESFYDICSENISDTSYLNDLKSHKEWYQDYLAQFMNNHHNNL